MKEKELWMEKLKEKLNNYSEPIPPSGWEQLEKELMPPVEKKLYPYRKWTSAAAAVVLLALVSSLSLYFLGTSTVDDIRHMHIPTLASTPKALPSTNRPEETSIKIEPTLHPLSKNRLAKVEHIQSKPNENERLQIATANSSQITGMENVQVLEKREKESTESRNATQEKKTATTEQLKHKSRRPSSKDQLNLPVEKRSSQKETWSMGLSVGNSGGTSTELASGASGYMSRVSMASVSNGLIQIPNDQTLIFQEGVPYLRMAKQVIDIEHHQPISFGVNVRKSLGGGFSLETGVTYTLLSSDVQLTENEKITKQKLHYLGIPLRANWNFLDKKLFTLYVSGGGMVEKCIYGKLGNEKETVKPLQFSVSGAVGAQINATKHVGVYIEPGVSYFFNDGSNMQTIRKETPFNFNIQGGIRFTY